MRTPTEFVILLLQIIKFNGNTNYLVLQGYSYLEIINSLEKLTIKGYVTQNENRMILTQKGNDYLYQLNKKMGRKGLYRYMSPQLNYKIKQMKTTEIYVPLSDIKE